MYTDELYKDWIISVHEDYRHEKQIKRIKHRNKRLLALQVILSVLIIPLTIGLNLIDYKEFVLPIVGILVYSIYKLQTCKRILK